MEDQLKTELDIFARIARICSRSEECSSDIRKKIKDLGADEELREKILQRLIDEKFVDDDRYVRAYVRDKFRINKWGRVKMRYYLKMKGIPEDIIEAGFDEIDPEEYANLLIKTMKEKAKSVRKSNKFEKMGQVIRFAQGRGFEPELIHRYLNNVMSQG
jgi:regulatory protein